MLSCSGFEGDVDKVERWLGGRLKDIQGFIGGVYRHDLHAKRVESLAGAALGVMTSASLAVATIGQALAQARGLVTKHAIKQVDRLLSNQGIDVWDSFACWVPYLIGPRKAIVVAMDWTDYDRDGQATLALNLVTRHGRATPLLWLTVWKDELTDQRNDFEDACLVRLKQLVPCRLCRHDPRRPRLWRPQIVQVPRRSGILATLSGFAAISTSPMPRARRARPRNGWASRAGRASCAAPRSQRRTQYKVGAVVCVHAKAMKEPWCLATSNAEATTAKHRELLR